MPHVVCACPRTYVIPWCWLATKCYKDSQFIHDDHLLYIPGCITPQRIKWTIIHQPNMIDQLYSKMLIEHDQTISKPELVEMWNIISKLHQGTSTSRSAGKAFRAEMSPSTLVKATSQRVQSPGPGRANTRWMWRHPGDACWFINPIKYRCIYIYYNF